MMVKTVALGVKQGLDLFVLKPAGIVCYVLLLSADYAFVALKIMPADCIYTL